MKWADEEQTVATHGNASGRPKDLVRLGYATQEDYDNIEPYINPIDPREEFKQQRAIAVSKIKVTTSSGNTFDGDETSQTRMARAIVGLGTGEAITWVLADNTVIQATKEELTEAMKLAGRAQADLWVQQP